MLIFLIVLSLTCKTSSTQSDPATTTVGNGGVTLEPSFDVPMVNVTVREGITAVLPCSVKYLGAHQVVWTDPWSTLLTHEDRRITDDERISVERPYTKDWNLHIRNVRYSDQGVFNCQINTDPIKIKTVNLKVQVPAKINVEGTSIDVTVREGEQVTLVCNVSGIPTPSVTWYRLKTKEDGAVEKERIGMSGEVLIIHNVSRNCGDIYECVASNGVPPDVSKQIKVSVEFPPEVRLNNKRLGQYLGRETILECIVTALPQGISEWMRGGQKLDPSLKYRVEVFDEAPHTVSLLLRIRTLDEEDFGVYTCVGSNALGEDSEDMVLYDYAPQRSTTTTEPEFPLATTPSDTEVSMKYNQITGYDHLPPSQPRTNMSPLDRLDSDEDSYLATRHKPIISSASSGEARSFLRNGVTFGRKGQFLVLSMLTLLTILPSSCLL